MPEFILDNSGEVAGTDFDMLDAFTQGYIEALFFTNESYISMVDWADDESQEALEQGTADGSLPTDAGFSDLYPDSLHKIHTDCRDFQRKAAHLLSQAYCRDGYDMQRAGQDFWYTRNHHGVGYWDRTELDSQGPEWDATQIPLDQWTPEMRATRDRLEAASLGTLLTNMAQSFGERDASFGDVVSGEESPTGYGWVIVE